MEDNRRPSLRRALAALLTGALVAAGAIVGVAAPAQALGNQAVSIPTVPRDGATVTVTGADFDPAGFGLYLGLRATGSSTDLYTVWIDDTNVVGTLPGLGATAPMSADGSFGVEVPVPAYSASGYTIVTRGAHGQTNPNNDSTTPVVYQAAPATATATALSVSPSATAIAGSAVTLTAAVSPAAAGSVTFYDGSASLGTAAVSAGSATLTTSTLAVGSRSLSAAFAPADSAAFAGSTSASVGYTITAPVVSIATTTTLAAAAPSTRALLGQPVTLSAAVAAATGSAAPTGTVEFFGTPAGSTTPVSLGSGQVANGRASLTTSALPAGGQKFTASFVPTGDAFAASTSTASANYGIVDTSAPVPYTPAADALTSSGATASWAFSAYANATGGAGAWAKAADGVNITATTGADFAFANGTVRADAGGAQVSFDGWFRITPNPGYGATFTDPVLSIRSDGSGVWTADVTTFGDAGQATHDDMVFATFRGAAVGAPGAAVDADIALDYANALARGSFSADYGNSWPAALVLALDARIQAYFYQSSTSAANLTKPPSPLSVSFDWPAVEATATTLTVAPATRALRGDDVTLTVAVTNVDEAAHVPSGSVEFFSIAAGASTRVSLGRADLVTGGATLKTDGLAAGGHTFAAVYSPDSGAFGGSEKVTTANFGVVDDAQATAYQPGSGAVVSDTAATASWAWSAYADGWTKVATGDISVVDGAFRFADGVVTADAGGAVVQFEGTLRVEAYAGFFPPNGQWVELEDPALHLTADGSGVWIADVRTGADVYSATAATTSLVVGTFSGLQNSGMGSTGARTVTFDYLDTTARGTWHADYGNSWPNAFVLAVPSAIQSFYYQSGTTAAQATKPAAALTVDFAWPVIADDTTTTIAVAPTTRSVLGSDVTLTAAVSPATATGAVEFFDTPAGGTKVSLGTAAVTNGVATLTTSALAAGGHSFAAAFTPATAFHTASASAASANYGVVDTSAVMPAAPTAGTAVTDVTARWDWSQYASAWTKVATGKIAVDGQTFVLSGGAGIVGADGSVKLQFSGTLRVEAYAGFFPPSGQWVELVDPTLVIDANGVGTWAADVRSGAGAYSAAETKRLTVATLTGAALPDFARASVNATLAFDYAGTTAAGTWSVKNGTAYTDAWTNEFILAAPAAIQAFYHASGAAADGQKAPSALSLAWTAPTPAAPQVTVTPASALDPNVENVITVSGTGFTGPGAKNGVYVLLGETSLWAGGSALPSTGWVQQAWVPAVIGGGFTTTLTLPVGSLDPSKSYQVATSAAHGLSVTDRSLDTFTPVSVAQVTVKPSITVSGDLVAGGTVTVSGVGFEAGDPVVATVHSDPFTLGGATVASDGRFTVSGTLPAAFPAGAHTVIVTVNGVEIASASVQIAAAPTAETPAVATCTAQAVSGASISWGVKQSFVEYINGPIANGSASIGWGSGSGSYNTDENLGRVGYGGGATFSGHGGLLDLKISNPTIQVTGARSATLSAYVSSAAYGGNPAVNGRVVLASLALPAASTSGGSISWSNASATLTASGAAAFGGFYTAGTAMDPVSFRFPLGAEVPCDPTTSGELAATGGTSPEGTVWLGLALLVLGAGLVVLRRRRTAVHEG